MVLKFSGLFATLIAFLALAASPTLCARDRVGFLHPHHHHYAHFHVHQGHSSKSVADGHNTGIIQMILGKEDKISSEPNTLKAPGHMGVSKQEADSMDKVNIPISAILVSKRRNTSGGTPFGPRLDSSRSANSRSLLDTSSNFDPLPPSKEDANLLLASFTLHKDDNLFNMLPRAHRVPPSGPSMSHNSMLDDKPT